MFRETVPCDATRAVVAGGAKHALVCAFMSKHFGGVVGQPLSAPTGTITAIDHHAVTTVALDPTERRAEVAAFLRTLPNP